ncbi:hypothetical protein C0993_007141 [Termitomyces sp. T159_Od127]|nr:hypothetical protein C0993_007141 [Termitomyces sp. T159_Od127]
MEIPIHRWTTQRKVFGKPLHAQAVIRSKLAAMIARAESVQNRLGNITYQMCNMSYWQQANKLAGQIAFLRATLRHVRRRPPEMPSRSSVVVVSQRRYHRTIPFDALLGGAEDVLADLGVRQALRAKPKNVRL